jgi:hypothetical protein
MRLGLGLSICDIRSGTAPTFDPATLSLTGWWRASFSASPWTGTASAGASGSRDLTEATNPPSTTTAVNGFVPALFDGVNDRLVGANNSNFVATNAGTFFGLIKPITSAADNATVYLNKPIFVDTTQALMGAGFSNNGFRPYLVSGTYKSLSIAMSIGSWHFVAMTWDGSALFGRVDGVTDTIACGSVTIGNTPIHFGTTYDGSIFANMQALELGFATTALTDANLLSIKSYMSSRYGLTLT